MGLQQPRDLMGGGGEMFHHCKLDIQEVRTSSFKVLWNSAH